MKMFSCWTTWENLAVAASSCCRACEVERNCKTQSFVIMSDVVLHCVLAFSLDCFELEDE